MLNKVILLGRLTKAPEIKETVSGTKVCSFSIAVDRNYVSQGEERKTDFINCTAWRKAAEFISKYFQKGSLICIEGSLQTHTWDDDGKKRYAVEVVVERAYFAGKKESGSEQAESSGGFGGSDDDLPF